MTGKKVLLYPIYRGETETRLTEYLIGVGITCVPKLVV